jgi:hypothetical protein
MILWHVYTVLFWTMFALDPGFIGSIKCVMTLYEPFTVCRGNARRGQWQVAASREVKKHEICASPQVVGKDSARPPIPRSIDLITLSSHPHTYDALDFDQLGYFPRSDPSGWSLRAGISEWNEYRRSHKRPQCDDGLSTCTSTVHIGRANVKGFWRDCWLVICPRLHAN